MGHDPRVSSTARRWWRAGNDWLILLAGYLLEPLMAMGPLTIVLIAQPAAVPAVLAVVVAVAALRLPWSVAARAARWRRTRPPDPAGPAANPSA